ncbi:MAG: hypothetical protein PHQ27_09725 [Victivallales bacterium]|nr:hypothetical protein [Victivallales bacterium]
MLKLISHLSVLLLTGAIWYYLSYVVQTRIPPSQELKLKTGAHLLFILGIASGVLMIRTWTYPAVGWVITIFWAGGYFYSSTIKIVILEDGFIYRSLIGVKRIGYDRICRITERDYAPEYSIVYDNRQKITIPTFLVGSQEFIRIVRQKVASARP